jgi:hypothetical protein
VAEVIRRSLHVVVQRTEQSNDWKKIYDDCLKENGIMNKFMFSASATPGKAFRGVVFAGIEWDAENYSARGARGKEPSELEIMSSIIIAERRDALTTHKAANDAKKNKSNTKRAENEAAEVQLGLGGASGLAAPSPTTTLLGGNPTLLFGGSHTGGKIVLHKIILTSYFVCIFNNINCSLFDFLHSTQLLLR